MRKSISKQIQVRGNKSKTLWKRFFSQIVHVSENAPEMHQTQNMVIQTKS